MTNKTNQKKKTNKFSKNDFGQNNSNFTNFQFPVMFKDGVTIVVVVVKI